MMIKKVNKNEFVEVAKAIGTATYQIVSNGNDWFEQLSDGKTVYQHKLLTIKSVKSDTLFGDHQEPSRIKDATGRTCAFVQESGSFVYYCLVPITKREKAIAERLVRLYARCVALKRTTPLPHQPNEIALAA